MTVTRTHYSQITPPSPPSLKMQPRHPRVIIKRQYKSRIHQPHLPKRYRIMPKHKKTLSLDILLTRICNPLFLHKIFHLLIALLWVPNIYIIPFY